MLTHVRCVALFDLGSESLTVARQGGFEIDGTDSEWGWYAEKVEGENGKLQFKCKWPIKGAHEGKCGYQAKRQLVQRHIENKHQNFRCVLLIVWDELVSHMMGVGDSNVSGMVAANAMVR